MAAAVSLNRQPVFGTLKQTRTLTGTPDHRQDEAMSASAGDPIDRPDPRPTTDAGSASAGDRAAVRRRRRRRRRCRGGLRGARRLEHPDGHRRRGLHARRPRRPPRGVDLVLGVRRRCVGYRRRPPRPRRRYAREDRGRPGRAAASPGLRRPGVRGHPAHRPAVFTRRSVASARTMGCKVNKVARGRSTARATRASSTSRRGRPRRRARPRARSRAKTATVSGDSVYIA